MRCQGSLWIPFDRVVSFSWGAREEVSFLPLLPLHSFLAGSRQRTREETLRAASC